MRKLYKIGRYQSLSFQKDKEHNDYIKNDEGKKNTHHLA